MRKIMLWALKYPLAVILIMCLLCCLAVFGALRLELDPSTSGMRIDDPAEVDFYQKTIDEFGNDELAIIYIHDDDLFTPKKLAFLERLCFALEEIKGINRVESLFTSNDFASNNGILRIAPLLSWVPESQADALEAKEQAMRNPLFTDTIVSRDGNSMAINLILEPDNSDKYFHESLTNEIEKLIQPLEAEFQRIFQLGTPYVSTMIAELLFKDQASIVPMAVAVLLIVFILITRRLSSCMLPIITAGTSILCTAGFMGFIGIKLNILTVLVPPLVMVIGSTEDMHLINEYIEGLKQKSNRLFAVEFMISKMGVVVFLTALTTFLGFLSVSINKIEMLREFGMVSGFAMFINPLITVLITPVFLRYLGPSKSYSEDKTKSGKTFFCMLSNTLVGLIEKKRKILIFSIMTFCALMIFGVFRVNFTNDTIGVFKKDSQVRTRINEMGQDMAGIQSFFIRVDSSIPGLFTNPDALRKIDLIQEYIARHALFDKSESIVDMIKLMNREFHNSNPAYYAIPDTEEEISQYLMMMHDDETSRYITSDFNQINIIVRHSLSSSTDLQAALDDLNNYIHEKISQHFSFVETGESILFLKGVDQITDGQVKSIGLMMAIIFIIMSILFVNIKAGFISLLPNIFPVLVQFGAMGLLGIPLNIGTAMVAALAIGIAVDDTIHMMTRYNAEMRRLKDQRAAMAHCIQTEIEPVCATSLAMAAGFSTLLMSNFVTTQQFGGISAIVIMAALLGDLLITPALLANTRFLTLWDMISLKLRKEVIEGSEFFHGLKPWQIKRLILLGHQDTIKADQHLFKEWDEGHSMFIILDGRCRSYGVSEHTNERVDYNIFADGEVIGMESMLEGMTRSSNMIADIDTSYVEITDQDFNRIRRLHPRLAAKAYENLIKILANRLSITEIMYRETKVT